MPSACCSRRESACPEAGLYQTRRRAKSSASSDWPIFNPRALSDSPIGLSFSSSALIGPAGALSSQLGESGPSLAAGIHFFARTD